MSRWRRQALLVLPELKHAIEQAESPGALWIQLLTAFLTAYDHEPPDEGLIRRVYGYALWAVKEAPSHRVHEPAAIGFFEALPRHPKVRDDMHRWLSPSEFRQLAGTMGYGLGQEGLARLQKQYEERRAGWEQGKPRRTTRRD